MLKKFALWYTRRFLPTAQSANGPVWILSTLGKHNLSITRIENVEFEAPAVVPYELHIKVVKNELYVRVPARGGPVLPKGVHVQEVTRVVGRAFNTYCIDPGQLIAIPAGMPMAVSCGGSMTEETYPCTAYIWFRK